MSVDICRSFGKRGSGLVIRHIRLTRIWEQRENSGDPLGRPGLTRGDHDAQVDEVVVDLAAPALYDVDILPANRVLNLEAALADGKFGENSLAGRDTQGIANNLDQLRMGITPKDDDITDHSVSNCPKTC